MTFVLIVVVVGLGIGYHRERGRRISAEDRVAELTNRAAFNPAYFGLNDPDVDLGG